MHCLFQGTRGAPSPVLSHPYATAPDLVRLQVHMLLDWLTEGPDQLTEQQLVWGPIIVGWALGDFHLVDDGATISIRLQLGDVGDVLLWLLMLCGLASDK